MQYIITQLVLLAIPAWYTLSTAPFHWYVRKEARPVAIAITIPVTIALLILGVWFIREGSPVYWLEVLLWWAVAVILFLTNRYE